ncbi:hypothetical protein [Knoellia subterranea]|uniref:Glycerophosphoryl diester phosphodiesterase membrane domain-containing protein n=1 Tax=Knoellia subterranea KCTC 19937 TaxID=1385521 RepID=A0A0A0JDY1_9MICO|nr:hypothetical protein [Knoellia subterranea]KGN35565.1 hypothetical protein N803_06535 [Knoellia subterranea KCTC 19937]
MNDQGWTAPGQGSAGPEQPAQVPPTGYPGHPAYPPMRPVNPPRMDFRPGIIPLRPLTMNDLFGGVFRAVRGNVAATVGLAALTSLIFLVPFTALGAWVSSQEPSVSIEESVTNDTAGVFGSLGSLVPSIGSWFSTILLAGFLAHVIGQAVLGRKVTAGQTWQATRPRLGGLVGATLLTSAIFIGTVLVFVAIPIALLVAGGTAGNDGTLAAGVALLFLAVLLALVAMAFLWTRLAFVTPSLILENLGVAGAFRRSWALTGGQGFWRLFGIRLLASFAIGVIASLITAPLSIVAVFLVFTGVPMDQLYMWQALLTGLSGVLAGAITTPITAGLDALLYVDHRIRREGLDVQLIQTAQGTAAPPWPGTGA